MRWLKCHPSQRQILISRCIREYNWDLAVIALKATPSNEDGSQVSTQERVVKDVQAPAMQPPTDEQFWSKVDPSKPDIAFLKNHFYREGRLHEHQALYILHQATEILKNESNLLNVDAPITVCGDIHGQYVGCDGKVRISD